MLRRPGPYSCVLAHTRSCAVCTHVLLPVFTGEALIGVSGAKVEQGVWQLP